MLNGTRWVLYLALALAAAPAVDAAPNVLMIWVDDLRPEIGGYGAATAQTPNLDRLIARSLRFDRAYCNIPVCGASRASVMTGLRGTSRRFGSFLSRADREAPEAAPLHRVFHDAGYRTVSIGKVFHEEQDCAEGWDELSRPGDGMAYSQADKQEEAERRQAENLRGAPWEVVPGDGEHLADARTAAAGCEAIARLADAEDPFFLAVGLFKPHLPFVAPADYWAKHPADRVALPANFESRPRAPRFAFTHWGELRRYVGMPAKGTVSPEVARQLIAGYRACVSYTDTQVGRLLDQLDASGAADRTIVVLLGDHGWNLGDHGMWCKHCCFETAMRTPLLVAAPTLEGFRGGVATAALTEFIDLYPTVCELAGLTTPESLPGESFVPLLRDPSLTHRQAAIGRYGAGETVRTDRYRYTEYRRGGKRIGEMLYDHAVDPAEDKNLAPDPAYAELVVKLRGFLPPVAP